MTVLKWIWNPNHFWPAWLCLFTGVFLLREIWALASGRGYDTLSDWWWRALQVQPNQPMIDWDAMHFLVFGLWCVLFIWLTYHFFFHDFA
jgi:hypothetical protein